MGKWQWLQKLPCLPFSSPVQFSFCFLSSHGHLTMFAYAFWLVQLDRPTPVNSEHTHRIYGMVAPWCALSTQSGHETHFLFKSSPKIYMRIVLGAHMRVARTKRWKWKISSFDIQRNFHMTPGMWDGECEQGRTVWTRKERKRAADIPEIRSIAQFNNDTLVSVSPMQQELRRPNWHT